MEKSTVDPRDYGGLQLDTRSPAERGDRASFVGLPGSIRPGQQQQQWPSEKRYLHEMRSEGTLPPGPPAYPDVRPKFDTTMKETVMDPEPPAPLKERRILGMKRMRLLVLVSIILAIVIVASVVGGIVGSRNAAQPLPQPQSSSAPAPTANPVAVNNQLPMYDVMVDSPIVPIAFVGASNDSGVPSGTQGYRAYFQSAFGNVKEIQQNGVGEDFVAATPIFTDAMNNTGLAGYNFLNGTSHQSSIFYAASNGVLIEKRNTASNPGGLWLEGTLSQLDLRIQGNSAFGDSSNLSTPQNGWDPLRMSAVYSANFSTGPGARLFCHQQNNTDNFIQEVIWDQGTDAWSMGAQLYGPVQASHMTAIMDQSGPDLTLRLFFAAPNNTLQEYWLNVLDKNSIYQNGIKSPNLLLNPSADIAAVSTSQGAFLYYASAVSDTANITIRELPLPDPPGSSDISASSTQVTMPALIAKDNSTPLTSIYAPLAAIAAGPNGSGSTDTITVFWADGVVDPQSGYGSMKAISRQVGKSWASIQSSVGTGVVNWPLGTKDCSPATGQCTS